jgi:hypothetical protein
MEAPRRSRLGDRVPRFFKISGGEGAGLRWKANLPVWLQKLHKLQKPRTSSRLFLYLQFVQFLQSISACPTQATLPLSLRGRFRSLADEETPRARHSTQQECPLSALKGED